MNQVERRREIAIRVMSLLSEFRDTYPDDTPSFYTLTNLDHTELVMKYYANLTDVQVAEQVKREGLS